jgi:pimeloyl-ACP methyl ester carboxylesterase
MAGALRARLPDGAIDAVGFSLGAKLLLAIALREPGRIRRLVLGGLGDNAFAPEAIGEAAACALELGPTAETPPPVLAFLETWEPRRNDARAVAAVLRRPPNPVFDEGLLQSLRLPILLVNGSEDLVGRNSGRLTAALDHAEVRMLSGVGHFDLTAQSGFIEAAMEFLGSITAPAPAGVHE